MKKINVIMYAGALVLVAVSGCNQSSSEESKSNKNKFSGDSTSVEAASVSKDKSNIGLDKDTLKLNKTKSEKIEGSIKAGNWYCYDFSQRKNSEAYKEDWEPYGRKEYYYIYKVIDKGTYNKLCYSEHIIYYSNNNVYEYRIGNQEKGKTISLYGRTESNFYQRALTNTEMENVMKKNLVSSEEMAKIHPKKFLDNSKILKGLKIFDDITTIIDENGNSDIDYVISEDVANTWRINSGKIRKPEIDGY